MLYFGRQSVKGISEFITKLVTWNDSRDLPYYGEDKVSLPINVRAHDDYLGALWMASDGKNRPFGNFPFNCHPDGFPYTDRKSVGLIYTPRANFTDFPTADGSKAADMRIAIITLPQDAGIIFLGGEDFDVANVTDEQWQNKHHYFIDISERDWDELCPVLMEPEEIRRQKLTNVQSLAPPGAKSTFAFCAGRLTQPLANADPSPADLERRLH